MQLRFSPSIGPDRLIEPSRLSRPVRHAKSNGQAKTEVGRVESESDRGLSLLCRLGRADDRSDEMIRHFDQFMNFEQTNLSKARLLRLSDDIASNWPGTVHENHPSEHEDRTGCVLLLTAGRAVGCTESGQGSKRARVAHINIPSGGSNAMGLFHEFVDDADVRMIGVEAAGFGFVSGKHAAMVRF
ncbi:hypothetical protein F2Q69_00052224 [Brassica cretica]|uniref:Uncharacterized protein n=1 Tax=Brassica cretica TaxID=69181 RepID=A0A8S9N2L2_BRACR|nr:hypothetical protein F2Q69_00052224 [Brassica cretica]